jgi:hypothetical protein
MCKIFNTIGSLNDIQYHLDYNRIDEYKSIDELINFRINYHFTQQQVILHHTEQIEKEKVTLEKEIDELQASILSKRNEIQELLQKRLLNLYQQIDDLPVPCSKVIPILKDYYFNLIIWLQIWFMQISYPFKVFAEKQKLKNILVQKNTRFNFIAENFIDAVNQDSLSHLQALRQKKIIIDQINNSIYGAIGEQKVVNILKNLSDDYVLINDFNFSFHPPLYYKKENNYIKSIQIDHLLIAPCGVFIIETKNWSEESIHNPYLFSPVKQINRTNFALFKILTDEMSKLNFSLLKHHWGNRKVPIRNIIVFINNKPIEIFQFAKILSLIELLPYIKYFTPSFSNHETQIITDFLLKISNKRNQSKLILSSVTTH